MTASRAIALRARARAATLRRLRRPAALAATAAGATAPAPRGAVPEPHGAACRDGLPEARAADGSGEAVSHESSDCRHVHPSRQTKCVGDAPGCCKTDAGACRWDRVLGANELGGESSTFPSTGSHSRVRDLDAAGRTGAQLPQPSDFGIGSPGDGLLDTGGVSGHPSERIPGLASGLLGNMFGGGRRS